MEGFDKAKFITEARQKGYTDQKILSFLQQKGVMATPQTQQEEQPGFFSRVGQTVGDIFRGRSAQFGASLERQKAGEQGVASTGLQLAGQSIGAGFDIIGAGLGGLLKMAPEKIKETVGSAGAAFLQTAPAQAGLQALEQGIESYQAWKAENPVEAANLEAFGNIASAIPAGSGARSSIGLVSKTGKPIAKTGQAIETSGVARQTLKTLDDVADLISPPVKKTKLPSGKKLSDIQEGGVFAGRKFSTNNPLDREIIDTVSKIPGIEKGNTLAKGQTMERYISNEAENLVRLTREQDVIFPKQELLARLNAVQAELAKTPLLTGDAGKTANKVIAEYTRRIEQANGKLSEVLQVRKDMDNWVKKFAGEKALSGEKSNAMSIAIKELRNETNDYLITKSPVGSEIQNSLKRQANTFRALDNVTPKALAEAGSKVERAVNLLSAKLGVRSKIVQGLALVTGVGAFGAMTAYAPVATGFFLGSAGLSGLYKAATSPTTRKQIGSALKGLGKEVSKLSTTDKTAVRESLDVLVGLGIISASELSELEAGK